jgi:LuxR family maltose regulon positive regulatory protein
VGILVRGRTRKLTLLDAPPGFGKTTLLAQWCAAAGDEQAFAWVSLDPADNDPVRFWSCALEFDDARAALRASPS